MWNPGPSVSKVRDHENSNGNSYVKLLKLKTSSKFQAELWINSYSFQIASLIPPGYSWSNHKNAEQIFTAYFLINRLGKQSRQHLTVFSSFFFFKLAPQPLPNSRMPNAIRLWMAPFLCVNPLHTRWADRTYGPILNKVHTRNKWKISANR